MRKLQVFCSIIRPEEEIGHMYNENAWKKYDEKELKDLFKFNDEYIEFISNNKTEREVTKATV